MQRYNFLLLTNLKNTANAQLCQKMHCKAFKRDSKVLQNVLKGPQKAFEIQKKHKCHANLRSAAFF